MIKVYISGPISGLDYDTQVKPQFNEAGQFINSLCGYMAVNPLNNGNPRDAPWSDHMRADIKLLCDCQFIYMLPEWQHSRGARLEWQIAQQLGIKNFNE